MRQIITSRGERQVMKEKNVSARRYFACSFYFFYAQTIEYSTIAADLNSYLIRKY